MADKLFVRTVVDSGDSNGGSSRVVWQEVTPGRLRRARLLPITLLSCVISLLLMFAMV